MLPVLAELRPHLTPELLASVCTEGYWRGLRFTAAKARITFTTVRHRTKITRSPGSRAAGLAMAYELIMATQDRWRAVHVSRCRGSPLQ